MIKTIMNDSIILNKWELVGGGELLRANSSSSYWELTQQHGLNSLLSQKPWE